jgi:hypothetical protein
VNKFKAFAVAVFAASSLLGCSLWSERVSTTCSRNEDCFRAQGETCNLMTKKCEMTIDASMLQLIKEPRQ